MAQSIVASNARMKLSQSNIHKIRDELLRTTGRFNGAIYYDFRYHSTLCLHTRESCESHPLVQLNETWKQMHYPPESGTIMLPARMVALVNQASNKESVLSTFSQFCNYAVNDIHQITHKLLEEKFIGQIDVLREMMQKALNVEYTADVGSVIMNRKTLYCDVRCLKFRFAVVHTARV